ncbi:pyridoxine 5'-phosphate synthase [Plebeiibacterium sediminum]|uniref:Pyridoxine 5'-phosphate synthase n=1 Tax=Plebeiibacterium sediminum TaxID=2992112 RepID=A0AAE3M5N8_9BACT|nr:pyridoxine 5'-phosphate synthase [Plebeiobacterium sediminum]MCW3787105.1 pyridoxine 5'-phosphate synthase [Plebeiobacterium sediminum]
MTKLSVNINKVATLRNSRGGDMPNVVKSAVDVQLFGADGVTVHPRPDERHITYQDVMDIKPIIKTEFNIEGYPSRNFIDLVKKVKPHQVTLVPDPPEAITSNAGWDTIKNKSFLQEIISEFSEYGIRTSIFIDTDLDNISNAAATGTDRVELYTEPYAAMYAKDREKAIAPFVAAAEMAKKVGLKINAGHDLSLENLKFFSEKIPFLAEVSIGHALICDALYIGLEKAVKLYKEQLKR